MNGFTAFDKHVKASEILDFINDTVLGRTATIGIKSVTKTDKGIWYTGVVTDAHLTMIVGGYKCAVNIVVDGTSVILHHDDGKYADIKFAFIHCN